MPMDVKENDTRKLVFNAKNVDIDLGNYGIEVEGKKLDRHIMEKIGVEEWEDRINLRGNITLIVEEIPKDVTIDSDFVVDRKEYTDVEASQD